MTYRLFTYHALAVRGGAVITPITLGCPIPPSDLMTPPVALMTIGGNPDRAPAVMKHNADALLSDRSRLTRWQKWYEKPLY